MAIGVSSVSGEESLLITRRKCQLAASGGLYPEISAEESKGWLAVAKLAIGGDSRKYPAIWPRWRNEAKPEEKAGNEENQSTIHQQYRHDEIRNEDSLRENTKYIQK
jgi:hypothetical protein